MRILNVTGEAFYPQAYGGVQVCLNEIMLAQQKMGHNPTLLAALWGGKLESRSRIAMRLTRLPWVKHGWESFDVYRKWFPWEHARRGALPWNRAAAWLRERRFVKSPKSLIPNRFSRRSC